MKKKINLSVYIALLFLIFLVVLFPYKEGFQFYTMDENDISGSFYDDISGGSIDYIDISNSYIPQYPYTF